MIPVTWNYDPETTQYIKERMIDFIPDNPVPSRALNYIQSWILWIVQAARNGIPELIMLNGGDDQRTISFYYYDNGYSGALSQDGTGALAKIEIPIPGSSENIEISYFYDVNERIDYLTIFDQNVTFKIAFNYSEISGNITSYDISTI